MQKYPSGSNKVQIGPTFVQAFLENLHVCTYVVKIRENVQTGRDGIKAKIRYV